MPRHVHIDIFAYSGDLPVHTSCMAMAADRALSAKGIKVIMRQRFGESLITRARNAAVAEVLADPEATDLIMIDADTTCAGEDIAKLMTYDDVDIIGAPYRSRNDPLSWPSIRWLHEDIKLDDRGLLEVEGIGTGLSRFSRRCLEQMTKAFPIQYRDPTNSTGKAWALFWYDMAPPTLTSDLYEFWGEDLLFCKRWRDMGGKVFADPSISTFHLGRTLFAGNLADYLKTGSPIVVIQDVNGKETKVRNFLSAPSCEGDGNVAPIPVPQLMLREAS